MPVYPTSLEWARGIIEHLREHHARGVRNISLHVADDPMAQTYGYMCGSSAYLLSGSCRARFEVDRSNATNDLTPAGMYIHRELRLGRGVFTGLLLEYGREPGLVFLGTPTEPEPEPERPSTWGRLLADEDD